jgi:hypothetical protein
VIIIFLFRNFERLAVWFVFYFEKPFRYTINFIYLVAVFPALEILMCYSMNCPSNV